MASDHVSREYRIYKIISYIAGGLVLAIVLGLLFGFLVQFLWNETIAQMFNVSPITFWQAFGLFFLAKIFFGFGGGSSSASSSNWRTKKRDKKRADDAELIDDESFRRYWQQEGKAAYEAFLAGHDQTPNGDERQGDAER